MHAAERLGTYGRSVVALCEELAPSPVSQEAERVDAVSNADVHRVEVDTLIHASSVTLSANLKAMQKVRADRVALVALLESCTAVQGWVRSARHDAYNVRLRLESSVVEADQLLEHLAESHRGAENAVQAVARALYSQVDLARGGIKLTEAKRRMREHRHDLARARNAHEAYLQILQRNARRVEVHLTGTGQLAAEAQEYLTASCPVPRILTLVRAALPASERTEWWREVASIYAESPPEDRRRFAMSYVLNATNIVHSAWQASAARSSHIGEVDDAEI